jgi:hypothetical protein
LSREDDAVVDIERKRIARALLLAGVFSETDGDERLLVDAGAIGAQVGLSPEEVTQAAKYLEGENLLKGTWFLGPKPPHVSITHWGVKEMEDSQTYPDRPTEHFPPAAVYNQFTITVGRDMVGSVVHQGTHESTVTTNIGDGDLTALRAFVDLARSSIERLGLLPNSFEEFDSELVTIEAQLKSPKPKKPTLSLALQSIKTILAQATTSAAAAGLLEAVNHIRL